MEDPRDIGGRSNANAPALGWRNARSAAGALLRRIAGRHSELGSGGSEPISAPGKDLERLHDIRWQITDDAQRKQEHTNSRAQASQSDEATQSIDEMRQARDAALEASRAKSRFLACMSHEIRTPMNGILGVTDLLLDGPLTGEQKTYVQIIAKSARALTSLIDEILDFSRIEAGKLALASDVFSIRDTVESCVCVLRPHAAAKGLRLDSHVAGDVPPLVVGDEARVRQVLLNLLSNAVKFTDTGHVRVEVSAHSSSGDADSLVIRLAVADTGIGLSAAECAPIFDEFEQAEAAARRQDGGSGLGLAIARRIARAMGGDISVTSQAGIGSTFAAEFKFGRADLGAAPGTAASFAPDTSGIPQEPQRNARILLAEDNAVNALLATRLLEREGCQVVTVQTGDAAVAAVARTIGNKAPYFDLVLMDIYMPRLDGLEASRAIRRLIAAENSGRAAVLPIVAVTASLYAEDRERYLAAGMDDVLAKPFDGRAVKGLLDRWLPRDQRQSLENRQIPVA